LNLDCLDYLLSEKYLKALKITAPQRPAGGEDGAFPEGISDFWEFPQLLDFVASGIDGAKSNLRRAETFYDLEAYRRDSTIIRLGLNAISAAFYPTILADMGIVIDAQYTIKGLRSFASDSKKNPFLGYMQDIWLPWFQENVPSLVGISVTYFSQVPGAITLAELLRSYSPNVPICMGGAAITELEKTIKRQSDLRQLADYYVFGEGESALLELARSVIEEKPLRRPGNVFVCKGPLLPAGECCEQGVSSGENVNELPTPDFRGLPLDRYFSPEPVFLLFNYRGCYWGKCAFCEVSLALRQSVRLRERGLVEEDIRLLQKTHNARFFLFADDAVSPKRLREISEMHSRVPHPFLWGCEARMERSLGLEAMKSIHAGGCRLFVFGNESAVQRVLDLMNKGVRLQDNVRIIGQASEAGIAVNLQNFVGFPTETTEEAQQTIRFLCDNKDSITSIAFGKFTLFDRTPVFERPEAYGLRVLPDKGEETLLPAYAFKPSEGMDLQQVDAEYLRGAKRLARVYPWNDLFLDGPFGAHLLLQVGHHGKTNLGELPGCKLSYEGLLRVRPCPASDIKVFSGGGNKILISPLAHILRGTELNDSILSECDGNTSVVQICGRVGTGLSGFSSIEEAATRVALRILDMIRLGFLKTVSATNTRAADVSVQFSGSNEIGDRCAGERG